MSNKRDQVVVGIQITQLTYSRFFPRRRRQLLHEVIAPIVRRLETVDLLHDTKKLKKLRWLLGFICPELTIARDKAPRFSDLNQQHKLETKIVDIGASDIDWPPPYESMLDEGATLLGFEPSESAFQNLLQDPKPNREYLQVAVGDGEKKLLNFFNDPGMTSCLPPNNTVLDIFFPYNTEVTKSEEIQTKRLDEIDEIDGIDLLKMDIQGFELEVLRNATTKLASTLVVDIEVSFVELYEGQPLFSDIERFLRQHGFQFHRFNYDADPALEGTQLQTVGPSWMVTGTGIVSYNKGQALWTDAIFVRDFTRLDVLAAEKILTMARVLHDSYQSYDLVNLLLAEYDRRTGLSISADYLSGNALSD